MVRFSVCNSATADSVSFLNSRKRSKIWIIIRNKEGSRIRASKWIDANETRAKKLDRARTWRHNAFARVSDVCRCRAVNQRHRSQGGTARNTFTNRLTPNAAFSRRLCNDAISRNLHPIRVIIGIYWRRNAMESAGTSVVPCHDRVSRLVTFGGAMSSSAWRAERKNRKNYINNTIQTQRYTRITNVLTFIRR